MGITICNFFAQLAAIQGCRPSSAPNGVLDEAVEISGQVDGNETHALSDEELPDSLPG